MVEKLLGDLLNELDISYPNTLTVEELHKQGFSDYTIHEALRRELIISPYHTFYSTLGTGERIGLSSTGFELLNQIRMKKSIEQLDASIKKFNESSDKSSTVLIGLTVFIGLLTILLIPEQKIDWVVIAYILFLIVLFHKKLLRIFRR